jgi:hypothetical protein
VESETGDLQAYGPTSAFRHLGKYSNGRRDVEDSINLQSTSGLPGGFAKYLPGEVYITQEQHDIAIDRFFMYYASWGMSCHFHYKYP